MLKLYTGNDFSIEDYYFLLLEDTSDEESNKNYFLFTKNKEHISEDDNTFFTELSERRLIFLDKTISELCSIFKKPNKKVAMLFIAANCLYEAAQIKSDKPIENRNISEFASMESVMQYLAGIYIYFLTKEKRIKEDLAKNNQFWNKNIENIAEDMIRIIEEYFKNTNTEFEYKAKMERGKKRIVRRYEKRWTEDKIIEGELSFSEKKIYKEPSLKRQKGMTELYIELSDIMLGINKKYSIGYHIN